MDLIVEFSKQHDEITDLVETGDVKYNAKDKERYEACKARIAVVLRAKRRIQSKNRVSNRSALVYLNNQLSSAPWKQKYYTADA